MSNLDEELQKRLEEKIEEKIKDYFNNNIENINYFLISNHSYTVWLGNINLSSAIQQCQLYSKNHNMQYRLAATNSNEGDYFKHPQNNKIFWLLEYNINNIKAITDLN